MDAPTPTFCKDLLAKKLRSNNFSDACGKHFKPKSKYSCSNFKHLDNGKNTKSKFKKEQPHHKRHHSQKFKLKNYSNISEMDDNKSNNNKSSTKNKKSKNNKIINNIYDFIRKHRFKLRNDFDRKHSEQFLQSKESAFEKPFLLAEELSIDKNRNFTFTLKKD